ncbi:MAG: hypothetical protein ACYCWW_16890 [Deltaproteobacteria bacterium]
MRVGLFCLALSLASGCMATIAESGGADEQHAYAACLERCADEAGESARPSVPGDDNDEERKQGRRTLVACRADCRSEYRVAAPPAPAGNR